jgi:hypothetical protein
MAGVLWAAFGLLFMPMFYFMDRFDPLPPDSGFPTRGPTFFFLPLFYGAAGFLLTAVAAGVYNLIAKWVGGLEIELSALSEDPRSAE